MRLGYTAKACLMVRNRSRCTALCGTSTSGDHEDMGPSDRQLVERCRLELPYVTAAFEVLLRRYEPTVFGTWAPSPLPRRSPLASEAGTPQRHLWMTSQNRGGMPSKANELTSEWPKGPGSR